MCKKEISFLHVTLLVALLVPVAVQAGPTLPTQGPLFEQLQAETDARMAADKAETDARKRALEYESLHRTNGDNALNTQIYSEAVDRQAADLAIDNSNIRRIMTEADERNAADQALGAAITNLQNTCTPKPPALWKGRCESNLALVNSTDDLYIYCADVVSVDNIRRYIAISSDGSMYTQTDGYFRIHLSTSVDMNSYLGFESYGFTIELRKYYGTETIASRWISVYRGSGGNGSLNIVIPALANEHYRLYVHVQNPNDQVVLSEEYNNLEVEYLGPLQ